MSNPVSNGGARRGTGRTAQRHTGAEPLGSKVPVHVAQLEADWWHHPVPSSPQSPQSAPNLQQPLPPGEGEGLPPPGVGVGEDDPETLKSKQAMKVSGFCPGAQGARGFDQYSSEFLKVSVGLPTLLTSLHVFPTFQTHRPIPSPPEHEKEEGTW